MCGPLLGPTALTLDHNKHRSWKICNALKTISHSGTQSGWTRCHAKNGESLCDGCARCCLNKLEDWDTGEIIWTNVACSLLDDGSCRCKDYHNRLETVPDCVPLDVEKVHTLTWLPPTCAYRLLDEGYDLYWWHPLVSGDPDTIHQAGISVRGKVVSEEGNGGRGL